MKLGSNIVLHPGGEGGQGRRGELWQDSREGDCHGSHAPTLLPATFCQPGQVVGQPILRPLLLLAAGTPTFEDKWDTTVGIKLGINM